MFDLVGGDVFTASRKCIAFAGRLLVVGFTSGRLPEMRVNHVLIKNYSVVGVHWGMYNLHDPALVGSIHADLIALFEAGKIEPLISERVSLAAVPAALTRLGGRGTWGKVVYSAGS